LVSVGFLDMGSGSVLDPIGFILRGFALVMVVSIASVWNHNALTDLSLMKILS